MYVNMCIYGKKKRQPEYICAVEQSDDTQTRQMPDENRWKIFFFGVHSSLSLGVAVCIFVCV
jgi:hypothetical protein